MSDKLAELIDLQHILATTAEDGDYYEMSPEQIKVNSNVLYQGIAEIQQLRQERDDINKERLGYIKANQWLKQDLEQSQREADEWKARAQQARKDCDTSIQECDEWKEKADRYKATMEDALQHIKEGYPYRAERELSVELGGDSE